MYKLDEVDRMLVAIRKIRNELFEFGGGK